MLWAITAYFNPLGSARRLENYRTFRKRLAVPLMTVEASPNGRFELREADADLLIQREAPDLLWQKERLINLALDALPASVHSVAWLDCDIVFERDDWHHEASRLLERLPMIQLFSRFYDLSSRAPPGATNPAFAMTVGASAVAARGTGVGPRRALETTIGPQGVRVQRWRSTGFAWAGRREVLARHGVYDGCVLGGGDQAVFCAAVGKHETGGQGWLTNARQCEHYLEWARGFSREIRGDLSHVPGAIYHLWHGEIRDRRYRERHRDLARFDFDPFADIALAENGCWRWSSHKPALHAFLREYFEAREEDRRDAAAAPG